MLNRNACPDFTPISPDELTGEEMTRPETTYFKDVWRNLKKRKTALASLFVLALLVVMVLAGPMMNEYNYYSNDYAAANQAPSALHWFGTDTLGRDLWTRVWVGGRVSLLIAILATVIPYAIGMLMVHFLDENFDRSYLEMVAQIRSEEYYINMMIAWYFATALAKQYEAALPYIEERRLASWTHNKAIQKAIESRRVSSEHKAYLRNLKMKNF